MDPGGTCDSTGVKDFCNCKSTDSCVKLPGSEIFKDIDVNLLKTGGFNKAGNKGAQKCFEDAFAASYKKIVDAEYDMKHKAYGTIYSGQQEDGSYTMWPQMEWCSDSYDPRFRPWYSVVASGPKDVVIVIDNSGSMGGQRIGLAKQAAKAVLKTLTWVDMVTVIVFNTYVSTASDTLIP